MNKTFDYEKFEDSPPEEVASTGLVADLSGGIKDLADWAVEVGYKVLIPETDAGNILKLMFEIDPMHVLYEWTNWIYQK
ncbi:hypothetical protein GGH93_004939 [Coemansia aciculifera]|nr:hypothetical protein GGH93_004939 [Coemansia aciculifera]